MEFTQTFTYDGLKRLTSASDSGGWSRNFNYDQWGNMWVTNATGYIAGPTPTSNVYNAKNQIGTLNYDPAGNLITLNANTPSYDAENRMTSLTASGGGAETLLYDALGQRVEKTVGGSTTVYVYDVFGQLVSEYSGGLWSRDYIVEGSGELIATENASGLCTTCYFGYDHLGSVRIVMDQNGGVVARHDYLPFGEELPGGMAGRTTPGFGAADLTTQRFTGQVRDSESGQDFFNARYFMAPLGRFNSADPMNAGASLLSSQSWNGYAYVLGNPLNAVDPSGMTSCGFANPCVGLYPSGSSKRPANQFGNLSPFGSYNASSLSSVINTINGSAYAGAVYYGDETGNSEVFDLGLNINSYTSYSISSYLNISYSTSVTASVMHVTPQAKPIKIHGNWCGPDWTGSQAGEYDPSVDAAGAYANPIDRQDSGCMHHDKCYFQCRQQNTCTPAARSSCFASCDRVLSRASSAIPPWQSGVSGPAIDLLMFFRGADLWPKDDPGPNPASCSSQ